MNLMENLRELLEAEYKLTKQDALLLLREIETGRGGLADLAGRKPEIMKFSQDALKKEIGSGKARLFRAIGTTKEGLRRDKIVSATPDFMIAWKMASDFPTLITKSGFVTPKPYLIRYDVPLSRIMVYVPALVDEYKRNNWKGVPKSLVNRFGEKVPIDIFLDAGEKEKEVIVDVQGLFPTKILEFDNSVRGSHFLKLLRLVYEGQYHGGEWYVKYLRKVENWYPDVWEDPNAAEKDAALYDNKAKEYKDFLK